MIQLTGKRLTIRDFQLADLDALSYWMQPGRQWQETDGPYYPLSTPKEVAEIIGGLEKAISSQSFPDTRHRMVAADIADNSVMGMLSRYWISQETNWAAIGISIYDPGNWGKGFGFEALGLWCQYLFDQKPEFVRLDTRTWSGNTGMMRLAEKLGFQKEAVFRMARIVNGEYYDSLGYGILRTEWDVRYPGGFAAHI